MKVFKRITKPAITYADYVASHKDGAFFKYHKAMLDYSEKDLAAEVSVLPSEEFDLVMAQEWINYSKKDFDARPKPISEKEWVAEQGGLEARNAGGEVAEWKAFAARAEVVKGFRNDLINRVDVDKKGAMIMPSMKGWTESTADEMLSAANS